MSCEIKPIITIDDFSEVQKWFGLPVEDWLNAVHISVSPTVELCALAHGNKLALISSSWLNSPERYTHKKIHIDANEFITAVVCVPLIAMGAYAKTRLEWTCVIVGTASGKVIVFNNSGAKLFTKEFHPEAVRSIKVESINEEKLYIFYDTVICNDPFAGLARSNDKIKILSSRDKPFLNFYLEDMSYEKWGYEEQYRTINDVVVVGPQSYPNDFKHLLMASENYGFNAKYKNVPQQTSLVITVGQKPYVGLHYYSIGALVPDISEMAKAAASKLKSTVSNFLSFGPQTVLPPLEAKKIPIVPMKLHSGLCDSERTGTSIYLSPDKDLAAVTDTFGRIILIDLDKIVAVRIWKGYREAQCAFVKVKEKSLSSSLNSSNELKVSALFLVIFTPSLECLEIWCLQRGERVAIFKAPKNGQLIYNNYKMMGSGGFHCASKVKCSINYCLFLDPTSKQLKKIHIPYHFAITDSNSKAAKDLYLLQRIKMCIRSMATVDDDADNDKILMEIQLFAKEFQTDKIRIGCIETLIKNPKIRNSYFKIILHEIQLQLEKHNEGEEEEEEEAAAPPAILSSANDFKLRRQLIHTIEHFIRLTTFYEYVIMDSDLNISLDTKINDTNVETKEEDEQNDETTDLELKLTDDDENIQPNESLVLDNENCDKNELELTPNNDETPLIWSENELENFKTFINLLQIKQPSTSSNKVTFDVSTKSEAFFEYLSVFVSTVSTNELSVDIEDNHDEDNDNDDNDDNNYCEANDIIILNAKKTKLFAGVGSTIFSMFLDNGKSLDLFLHEAIKSNINSDSLIKLLISYWLDKSFSYTTIDDLMVHLTRFKSILHCICTLAEDNLFYLYNELNDWWQSVREMLLESPNAIMSLLAAMSCRNYAFQFRPRENSTDDNNSDEDVWETVSQESAQWTLLIAKLEDVAVLGVILQNCRPSLNHCDSNIHSLVSSYSPPDISLKIIITGGLGIVSKLVVNWILLFNIDPNILIEDDSLVTNVGSSSSAIVDSTEQNVAQQPTTSQNTIDDDNNKAILDSNSVTFLKYLHILRKHFPFSLQSGILLTGMTWEYMRHWTKSDMHFLKKTLICLETFKPDTYCLAHGICSMIWQEYLKKPLISTIKLIHKTGRLPKEILCKQNVGISDTLIPEFLDHCLEFLQHYRRTNNKIHANKSFDIRTEELLHDRSELSSLVQLAKNVPRAQDVILDILSECLQVILIVAGLNIKYQTPISRLFDEMSTKAIFSEVTEKLSYSLVEAHLELQKRRMGFLCQAITATMDLIVRESVDTIFLDDHEHWMGRCDELANVWNLHNDELKKHQVVELYAHGFDKYGCEQLERVLDTYSLGAPLLDIAAKRMNAYFRIKPSAYAEVAIVGTILTDFLDSLSSDDDRMTDDISLDELMQLCLKTFKCLSEQDSRNAKIAAQMCDACNILQIK